MTGKPTVAGDRSPATDPVRAGTPILDVAGVSKTFGPRTVLSDFHLTLAPGEIHALLGQNGSGKSTVIKILTGYHAPDEGGWLSVRGTEVSLPLHAGQARELGLAAVHQNLALVDGLSVLENLRVGRYATRAGWRIPWRDERRHVRALLDGLGIAVDPDAPLSSLAEADRAMIAVARATEELGHIDGGLLVLDEPTVYLNRDSVGQLFGTVRQAASDGHAVLLVTHRLDEVFEVAEVVTVLRDGATVATTPTGGMTEDELVELILGRAMQQLYPDTVPAQGAPVLRVSGLAGRALRHLDLEVRSGEIVGLTGLMGMGAEEVPYLLGGAHPGRGTIEVDDLTLDVGDADPHTMKDAGVVLLPADRAALGGVATATVLENLTLATLGRYFGGGRLDHRREQTQGRALLDRFDVRPAAPAASFSTLSGGNQQKVLLAKWFEAEPSVYLLHEPTQGVDIGAKQQIFAEVDRAKRDGTAFVIASVEHEDLAHLCDRVIVLSDGEQVAELRRGDLTADRIADRCYAVG